MRDWKGGKYDGEPQCFDKNPAAKHRTITKEMVCRIKEFLGEEGLLFFRTVKKHKGKVNAVVRLVDVKAFRKGDPPPKMPFGARCGGAWRIPHPIHFREGMEIRNKLRETGLCDDWSDHDLDNNWHRIVEKAIEDTEEKIE